jgi:hypothetical protein
VVLDYLQYLRHGRFRLVLPPRRSLRLQVQELSVDLASPAARPPPGSAGAHVRLAG